MLVMPPGAKLLSSRMTSFYKRVLPVLWFALVLSQLGIAIIVRHASAFAALQVLFTMLLLTMIGVFVYRAVLWDLMDEVWDDGKELLVVNEGHVEHVPLASIINIGYSKLSNPKRATLRLRQAGRWGERLSFLPAWHGSSILLQDNPVLEELISRVDAARQKS